MTGMAPTPSEAPDREGHAARQWSYFKDADEAKFRWQTTGPVFSASEGELVSVAVGKGSLLEVGCGEGGNLFHLGRGKGLTVGLDYSMAKAAFASGVIPWARLVCGDAVRLPFRRNVFDRVLCRDLLHHLGGPEQLEAVKEMFRVCRPGGEVVVIEPNGRNPLMGVLALVVPAERGLLRSTPARVAAMVGRLGQLTVEMAQPFPIARALLHYRVGFPTLGHRDLVAWLLRGADAISRRLVPRPFWAYIVVRGQVSSRRSEGDGVSPAPGRGVASRSGGL